MNRAHPDVRQHFVVTLGAGVACILGSFGPWVKGLGGVITVSGTDGGRDGWFTVVVGILALLVVWRAYSVGTWAPITLLLVGAVGVLVGVNDIKSVSGTGQFVSAGWGLYLATAASGVVALAGLTSMRYSRTRQVVAAEAEQNSSATASRQPPPSQPPAGWYANPNGEGQRWWDGGKWTEHTQ